MSALVPAHVIVTSIIGTFHCSDVQVSDTRERQWFHDSPVALADPSYAFGWAANAAWEDYVRYGYLHRQVWLIIGGRVADFFDTRGAS